MFFNGPQRFLKSPETNNSHKGIKENFNLRGVSGSGQESLQKTSETVNTK